MPPKRRNPQSAKKPSTSTASDKTISTLNVCNICNENDSNKKLRARRRKKRLPHDLPAYRHIGIYAYRCGFLREYSALQPSAIERFESLEQLRALTNGYRIAVSVSTLAPPPGIDTPEDLERVRGKTAQL